MILLTRVARFAFFPYLGFFLNGKIKISDVRLQVRLLISEIKTSHFNFLTFQLLLKILTIIKHKIVNGYRFKSVK